ncbi:L-fuculose-phosphate aldolase [Propionispira arboris]|uniref:L-fuculose-phosphate aldolase n=1 Tax=Propionispira arboris TaxID=84035 RepID=A0A1H7D1X1_9FIRM|nr:class II aldolase/adducin family protein [Propionispira arboris]SEJ93512.1 L-fuculose-phosphate aldolase [Propionispira arboris]
MLDKLKQEVVKYALEADRSGLCKHRSGNFSMRDPKTGYVCITPTGVDRAELSYHDIVVIDLDAKVIEAETGLRPTSETLMHLAAYKMRQDVNAVAHTHSRFATSFSILKKPIPAIVYEVANLGCKNGYIPVADYGRPGTPELAERTVAQLKISDVVLMESHGVIAVDADIKEALLKAHYVEEMAEIYYRTLTLTGGTEPHVVPLEELQKWEYPKEIQLLPK